jgi:Na+/proline symporter
MSSVSSALTSLSSVSTMDFVKALARKERSELYYLNFSKISTIFWAFMLVFVAYLSRQVDFVLNASFSLRGLTSGALLGGLLLAVFWKKGRSAPVIAGMIASLLVMTAIQVLPKFEYFQSPKFSVGDITNLKAFVSDLKEPAATNAVAKYLNTRISDATHNQLVSTNATNDALLEKSLVVELNSVIRGGPIYDAQRFEGVKLSDDVKKRLAIPLSDANTKLLNRQLLLEAYPRELALHIPEIFWPWYTLIGTSVTIGIAWLVRSLSPKAKAGANLPP